MSPDSSPAQLETLASLRRRGLLPAESYRLQVEALTAARDEAPPGPVSGPWLLFGVFIAVLGCVIALPAVILQEIQSGVPFIAAAVIEEALKPAGVYILMLRWPRALGSRLHVAVLCAIAGLTFGLIESWIYVTVYFPDEGSDFVLFRFTVPVTMHVVASFIVGLGLSRTIFDWAAGRAPFPKRTRRFYFAGAGLHALYNVTAIILVLNGDLNFD
jgi:RsiW-degrading membrane proteinase PrsW (M82 family)